MGSEFTVEIAAGDGKPGRQVADLAEMNRLNLAGRPDQIFTGRLAYLKVGRRRIITRQHLEAFLAQTAS